MELNRETILNAINILQNNKNENMKWNSSKIEQNSEDFMRQIRLHFIDTSKVNGYVSGYYAGIPIIENKDITKGEAHLIGYKGEILQILSFEK